MSCLGELNCVCVHACVRASVRACVHACMCDVHVCICMFCIHVCHSHVVPVVADPRLMAVYAWCVAVCCSM